VQAWCGIVVIIGGDLVLSPGCTDFLLVGDIGEMREIRQGQSVLRGVGCVVACAFGSIGTGV